MGEGATRFYDYFCTFFYVVLTVKNKFTNLWIFEVVRNRLRKPCKKWMKIL